MAGDVKLKETGVEIEGVLEVGEISPGNRQLKVNGWDLLLDCKDRRRPDSETVNLGGHPTRINYSSQRRALVHDVGDKLTLNYGGDYPGGVEIPGQTQLETLTVTKHLSGPVAKLLGYRWFGRPASITCLAQDLVLADIERDKEAPASNVALSHLPGDKLVINRAGGYKGGVTIEGAVTIPVTLTVDGLNLAAELKQLKAEITQLKSRLAKLESSHG